MKRRKVRSVDEIEIDRVVVAGNGMWRVTVNGRVRFRMAQSVSIDRAADTKPDIGGGEIAETTKQQPRGDQEDERAAWDATIDRRRRAQRSK